MFINHPTLFNQPFTYFSGYTCSGQPQSKKGKISVCFPLSLFCPIVTSSYEGTRGLYPKNPVCRSFQNKACAVLSTPPVFSPHQSCKDGQDLAPESHQIGTGSLRRPEPIFHQNETWVSVAKPNASAPRKQSSSIWLANQNAGLAYRERNLHLCLLHLTKQCYKVKADGTLQNIPEEARVYYK